MEKQRVHFGQPRQDTPILFLSIVSNPSLPLPRPDKPMPKADTHNWPDRSPDIHKHGHPPRKQRHLTHVISPCALFWLSVALAFAAALDTFVAISFLAFVWCLGAPS